MTATTLRTMADVEAENARLLTIIANALAAMDKGVYGDARRILKTGDCAPVKASSVVLAFPGR